MEVIITSSILNAAEQFAFMQQTLLLQIFRGSITNETGENGTPLRYSPSRNTRIASRSNGNDDNMLRSSTHGTDSITFCGSASPNTFSNSSSLSSPSPSASPQPPPPTFGCPTCVAFNDGKCCQNDSGLSIFQEFRTANMHCYWDVKLSEAIANLR